MVLERILFLKKKLPVNDANIYYHTSVPWMFWKVWNTTAGMWVARCHCHGRVQDVWKG